MSNVKTGDLAWWMTDDGNWPVCTVGDRCLNGQRFRNTAGRELRVSWMWPSTIVWWVTFPRPTDIGHMDGERIFAITAPVEDVYLKRIKGPDVPLPANEVDVFTPGPLDADERAREKERKEKAGTVKPKQEREPS